MGRKKGTFVVPANYEPQKAAPFDARTVVESKQDLVLAATWADANGDIWIYTGLRVSVTTDVNSSNNGLYLLIDKDNYTSFDSWKKLADETDLQNLQEQIDNIEAGTVVSDLVVDTEDDLPEIGNSNITYYVKENNKILRWDDANQLYISFGGSNQPLEIKIINGGNANGTNN